MLVRPLLLTILALALVAASGGAGGCAQRAPHMMAASGDRAIAKGDYALAESEYARVTDEQPWNSKARLQYGKALLGAGNPREAREQLEKAYTSMPRNDEVIANLADAMGQSGDVTGAVRLLSTVAEERKRPVDYLRLGRFAQKARDYDTAERAYLAAALGDAGINIEPQMALYQFYDEVGRDAEAVDRLAMALWVEPQNKEIQSLIREHGEIPGPTFAKRPIEQTGDHIPNPVIPRTTQK